MASTQRRQHTSRWDSSSHDNTVATTAASGKYEIDHGERGQQQDIRRTMSPLHHHANDEDEDDDDDDDDDNNTTTNIKAHRQFPPVSEQSHKVRRRLGLNPRPPIHADHDVVAHHHELAWSRVRVTLKEPFAEFWGTFIMVFFGNGSVAQVLLSSGLQSAPGGNGYGAYNAISWGWALGVLLGIYISGDAGGYLNPAITFTQCLFRTLPWRRFPIYLIAQFLGGFAASGVVYGYYLPAIDDFEGAGPGGNRLRTLPPNPTATAAIFCTYPQPFLTTVAQFRAELIETSVLMFCVLGLQDMTNAGPAGHAKLLPLGLFFVIWGLGACFGYETGYAMNLARDLGPRLMSYAVGYGSGVWSAGNYYFWIPIVAPFVGCAFGAFLYDLFIYTGAESPVNTPWLGLKRVVMLGSRSRGIRGGKGGKGEGDEEERGEREQNVGRNHTSQHV